MHKLICQTAARVFRIEKKGQQQMKVRENEQKYSFLIENIRICPSKAVFDTGTAGFHSFCISLVLIRNELLHLTIKWVISLPKTCSLVKISVSFGVSNNGNNGTNEPDFGFVNHLTIASIFALRRNSTFTAMQAQISIVSCGRKKSQTLSRIYVYR